ncbi:glucosyltransferase domain-containing protein [Helicobacter sp. 23-1044]
MNFFYRFCEMYVRTSLPRALFDAYKSIDSAVRRAFWAIFIITNLTFAFHTIHFLWGNHDWLAVFEGHNIFAENFSGRYTQHLISLALQGGRVLPVLNNLLAFGGIAFGAVLICALLNVPKRAWIWAIIGLMLTLTPLALTRLYYAFQVSGLFIAIGIGILGLYVVKDTAKLALCVISICLLHFGIASYQPFINTIFVLLCGAIIANIIDFKGDLKVAFCKSRSMILCSIFSALSYKIVLDALKWQGIAIENYNNQMTPIAEIPTRIALIAKSAFENLVHYEYAFMPQGLSALFLAFAIALVILIFVLPFKIRAKFAILALLVFSLFATLFHILLSKNIVNDATTDFYGLAFWRVVVVALVFKASFAMRKSVANFVRNSAFLLGVGTLWVCIVCDLHAQRMQKFAFDAHTTLLKTIVAKIETLENFAYGQKYHFLMFGDIPNMRHRYGKPYFETLPQDKIKRSGRGLGGYGTLIPSWSPLQAFEFYMLEPISGAGRGNFGDYLDGHKDNALFQSLIVRLRKAGILERLKPYPHKDSLVLFEDIIVLVASKGHLDEVREMAKGWE